MPLLPRHKEQAAAFRAHKRGRPSIHELTVVDVTRLTDDAVAVTFEAPEELRQYYRFKHGQHLSIVHQGEEGEVRRSYSICTPASSGRLRVGIRRVPGGAFSNWAAERLKPGDRVRVMTPTGFFTTELDPSSKRRYVTVAGGSGITPILSMIGTILEGEPESEITLLYANRTHESTMFADELAQLQDRFGARLAVHHFRSRAPEGARRLDAAALEELLAGELRPERVDMWLMCGPSALMHAIEDELRRRGVPEESIHRELFSADDEPLDTAEHDRPLVDSEVVIRMDGKEVTVPLSSHGETVLKAALPQLPDLPYSCSDGMCATCRAKLVEGEVEMDRCSGLEAAERKEGWILVCQAHPVTPRVVVDFDA